MKDERAIFLNESFDFSVYVCNQIPPDEIHIAYKVIEDGKEVWKLTKIVNVKEPR